MRLLFVVHGFVPEGVGGVELHAWYLASALAAEHAVAVLSWRSDPAAPEYAVEERRQGAVTVWRLNHTFKELRGFEGTYRNPAIDDRFDELAAAWRPDVVHVHHLIGLSAGILERTKRRGLPLVLGLHDYWFGCPKGQRIREDLGVCHDIDRRLCVPCLKPQNYELRAPRSPLGRWVRDLRWPTRRRGLRVLRAYDADMHQLLGLPDAFVVPSRFHREMYARYGVDARRVHVLPYGLPREGFAAHDRAERAPFRIGFLGTLIPSKAAHVLVEAYRLLARPEATLDIHGNWVPFHGDAGYLDRLRDAARTIPGTIGIHGRYEPVEVPRILAGLDVLVVPSVWYESYSIVMREAFLAGVPVVASGHGPMAEAIEHGVSGLLFRPGDAADLAAQLRRLMDEPGLRARLAAHPKEIATIAENAGRHLEMYRTIAGTTEGC